MASTELQLEALAHMALIVVDLQEDFCPPNGPLAVTGGRDVADGINKILRLPFGLKVCTQDWHPQDHISFASNHTTAEDKAFSEFAHQNPRNSAETVTITLWPDHCVQGSDGAKLIQELDISAIDPANMVKKGQDKRVEMWSAFQDCFKHNSCEQSNLLELLKGHSPTITDVTVVGLAMDFCVKHTALDAAAAGFRTVVFEDLSRAIDQSETGKDELRRELRVHGVAVKNSSDVSFLAL
ncbi:MAG: NAD(+) salvage pathway protein [Alyxoria varia]|nr:MAG: NAD(+) salvage pathway protein [Alyxoria varia]